VKGLNVVGITGGIGCGKTAVTNLFMQYGITIVDADIIAREVVGVNSPALNAISDHYGRSILRPNKSLDRTKLRQIIFNQPTQKQWLEALLHPLIRERIVRQLEKNCANNLYAVLCSPLLLETDQKDLTKLIIVVDLAIETQIVRAMKRDNNSRQQIESIIAHQMDRDQRANMADIVINNEGSLPALSREIARIHLKLIKHFEKLG
jgi:dephospho-CoA kinase